MKNFFLSSFIVGIFLAFFLVLPTHEAEAAGGGGTKCYVNVTNAKGSGGNCYGSGGSCSGSYEVPCVIITE